MAQLKKHPNIPTYTHCALEHAKVWGARLGHSHLGLGFYGRSGEEGRQPHSSFQLAGDEFLMAGADCGQCELWFSYMPHETGYGRRIWNAEVAKQTGANRVARPFEFLKIAPNFLRIRNIGIPG